MNSIGRCLVAMASSTVVDEAIWIFESFIYPGLKYNGSLKHMIRDILPTNVQPTY